MKFETNLPHIKSNSWWDTSQTPHHIHSYSILGEAIYYCLVKVNIKGQPNIAYGPTEI